MPSLSSMVASAPMAKNMGKEMVEIVDKCVVWSRKDFASNFTLCGPEIWMLYEAVQVGTARNRVHGTKLL